MTRVCMASPKRGHTAQLLPVSRNNRIQGLLIARRQGRLASRRRSESSHRLDKLIHLAIQQDPAIGGAELLDVLIPRRHVKALFFGHTHRWEIAEREGLHLVNLPAVAYTFIAGGLTGWTDCRLRADGMSLQIQANDQQHALHGKVTEFSWRGA